jgi:ubiquitin-like 1-activating enzyme E1 A
MAQENGTGISADEVALYDRQIRLWGMEAQERLRNAHILVVTIRALANEVVKNLVLAGVGAVTVLDDAKVTEEDLGAQFLVHEEDVGRLRAEAAAEKARKLNPRVAVHVDTTALESKDEAFFAKFDVVVVCDGKLSDLVRINGACRTAERPFFAGEIPGMYGYIFADLLKHDYVTEREETKATGERQRVTVPATSFYTPLSTAINVDFASKLRPKLRKKVSPLLPVMMALLDSTSEVDTDTLFKKSQAQATTLGLPDSIVSQTLVEDVVNGHGCELSPVAAIVGGILAQDVLNVLSKRSQPVDNWFVYNGETGDGPIYKV